MERVRLFYCSFQLLRYEYVIPRNTTSISVSHFAHRILVPEYGFMHLDLIPMLVGFFTYKIATFMQAIEEAVNVASGKTEAEAEA